MPLLTQNIAVFNKIRLLPLECGTFNGKELDKFAFTNFTTQFKYVTDSKKNLSGAAKLSHLKGYCRNYAAQVIHQFPLVIIIMQ